MNTKEKLDVVINSLRYRGQLKEIRLLWVKMRAEEYLRSEMGWFERWWWGR